MLIKFRNGFKPAGASLAVLALFAAGASLSACSDFGQRTDRAKEIADAAAGQMDGTTIIEDAEQNLQTASIEDRALAGTIRNDIVQTENFAPMFAVGSIIAKPADIPDSEPVAVIEDDEVYIQDQEILDALPTEAEAPIAGSAPGAEDTSPAPDLMKVERAPMPVIKLDPEAREKTMREIRKAESDLGDVIEKEPTAVKRTRSLRPRNMEVRSLEGLGEEGKAEVRRLARRSVISPDTIKAQVDANTVMLNALEKFGMGGEVSLSREGQMVIQVGVDGADPTQLTPEKLKAGPLAFLAIEKKGGCANPGNIEAVKADPVLATECVISELKKSGQFEYVEKDYIFENQFVRRPKEKPPTDPGTTNGNTTNGSTGNTGTTPPRVPTIVTPNDPLWALQWHFKNNGSAAGQSPGGASFQDFWSRQAIKGSEQVVVAVVDTGLQLQHPDIKNSPNLVSGWDMVSDPRMGNDGDGRDSDPNDPGDMCDPTAPYAEDTFHGTHVAGTVGVASTDNGSGVAGGAWQVKIVPVRALGKCGGRLSDINDAIRWSAGLIPAEGADGSDVWNEHPADIINLSIGLFGACPASMQDAINAVVERGAIVVSAAGNARVATQFYAPGGCQNVISVAAGDARGQITPYSNFGPEVDILAPGGDLTRDDNADGRPDGVLSTKAAKNCYDPVTGEGVDACYYAYEQGTSMAAPHVSAALALLKARAPTASPEELKATLLAAMDVRTPEQCAGLCAQYPGTEPIPGSPDMCRRPCGGLLNLSKVPAAPSGGGGRQK